MAIGIMAGNPLGRAVNAEDVRAALAQLSAEYRQVVVEIYFNRRSAAELAQILGIPAATIRVRCYDALRQLRGTLAP